MRDVARSWRTRSCAVYKPAIVSPTVGMSCLVVKTVRPAKARGGARRCLRAALYCDKCSVALLCGLPRQGGLSSSLRTPSDPLLPGTYALLSSRLPVRGRPASSLITGVDFRRAFGRANWPPLNCDLRSSESLGRKEAAKRSEPMTLARWTSVSSISLATTVLSAPKCFNSSQRCAVRVCERPEDRNSGTYTVIKKKI